MGRRVLTAYTDDITGEDVPEIHVMPIVGVDGYLYEIELGEQSLKAYMDAIEPFRANARRLRKDHQIGAVARAVMGHPPITPAAVPAQRLTEDQQRRKMIREWWSEFGERADLPPFAERGRIPDAVMAAFDEFGGQPIPAPEKPAKRGRRAAPTAEFQSADVEEVEVEKTPRKRASAATVKGVARGSRRRGTQIL